jgi:transposase
MASYIGLDGHSGTTVFVTVDDTGKVLSRLRTATTERLVLDYVRAQKAPKKLIVEECHMAQWYYLLLHEVVDDLVICNPAKLGAKRGAKDDFPDAFHLANELRCNHFERVFHEDSPMWCLRSLVYAYLDVTRQLTQTKNRYKAIFRASAIETGGSLIYHAKERIDEIPNLSDRFVASQLFNQLAQMEASKEAYIKEFERYKKKYSGIRKLCTTPGIDTIRAAIIASIVCAPERFADKHKFWAYSMLVKYTDKSDGVVYGKRSVQGRRELKGVFDGAALSVLRGKSALRKEYDRQRTKKVPHGIAKKALARKIASISLSILKNDTVYDDLHEVKRTKSAEKSKSV